MKKKKGARKPQAKSSKGWHNRFEFKEKPNSLLVTSYMYTGYKITSFIVSGVKPRDYLSYVTPVYEFKNWLFLVYVSNKSLRYIIHSGYHHRDSGTIWRGMKSIRENKVKITHRGKYGIRIAWNDEHGRAHKGTIDLWHGFYTGKARPKKKQPIAKVGKKSNKAMRREEMDYVFAHVFKDELQPHCHGCNQDPEYYCTLVAVARGLRHRLRMCQDTHPGDDNCLNCDRLYRLLEQAYTDIANCPHH